MRQAKNVADNLSLRYINLTVYCLLKRPFHRKVSQLRFFNCYCRTLFYNEFVHVKNLDTLLLYYFKKITSFAIRAIVI